MGFLRFIVFGYVGLSILYWLISIYSRSVRREKLEEEWEQMDQSGESSRDAFLDEGMKAYHNSFRPKLILLVYIIPTVLVIAALIVRNSN